METNPLAKASPFSLSRRRFVLGGMTTGVWLILGAPCLLRAAVAASEPQLLQGNNFDLSIGSCSVNYTGVVRDATMVNGSLPAPTLRWKEGERVRIRVTNHLAQDTSIHWHGIILPSNMDGVPGLSFAGIRPGATFEYHFTVRQSGTYWYHSHSGHQEQTGLYGALIIDPRENEPFSYDRDYVVLLSDWSDEEPHRIFANLKKLSHYYNFRERTATDLWRDIRAKGLVRTWNERAMWNMMRMSDRDIADVTGSTYTFLMNGQPPASGWTGLFRRGERIRLRVINGSAMTFFDIRIPGLRMTVVAADGQPVQPVTVDEFRIGVAETYDVIVEPHQDTAYTIFAQAMDRSGFARGTLTPHPALTAAIPAMDPAPVLTHVDMGMGEEGNHAGHDTVTDHATGNHTPPQPVRMDHNAINHGAMAMDHGGGAHAGDTMSRQDDSSINHHPPAPPAMGSGRAGHGSAAPVRHPASEYGPQVDMRAENPRYRLDDPGVGLRDHLRDHGRRVLTYADLRNLYATPDPREPGREIELHLTGNMSRYMWSFDGIPYADAEPISLRYGERLRITLVNDTMMNHPIHLHGMWSDLETGDGRHIPRKHTIIVQPGAKISHLVTADAMGRWAYHCHLLYHMMGMFREVRVS
ncbi:MAG: copper resistance system multicopper oxidase [Thermodesulfobacteriota bacterium]